MSNLYRIIPKNLKEFGRIYRIEGEYSKGLLADTETTTIRLALNMFRYPYKLTMQGIDFEDFRDQYCRDEARIKLTNLRNSMPYHMAVFSKGEASATLKHFEPCEPFRQIDKALQNAIKYIRLGEIRKYILCSTLISTDIDYLIEKYCPNLTSQ